jgi:DNA-binding GntR family transcriptional regulator
MVGEIITLTDAQRAYQQIKERIVTTVMEPGAVVQEADLMNDLGLGRTPVREALKLLEAENLVVVSPRRGIFVADVTLTDLLHVQEIRLELDSLTARLAVQRATADEVAEVCRLVAECKDCEGRNDPRAMLLLDRQLHAVLRDASHNRLLANECEMLFNLSLRIWYLFVNRLEIQHLAEDAFDEILEAIRTQDVARADRAMRGHIMSFGDSIKHVL